MNLKILQAQSAMFIGNLFNLEGYMTVWGSPLQWWTGKVKVLKLEQAKAQYKKALKDTCTHEDCFNCNGYGHTDRDGYRECSCCNGTGKESIKLEDK